MAQRWHGEYPWKLDSPQVLVSQGYLVAQATLPPPSVPSLLYCPGHLVPPEITYTCKDTQELAHKASMSQNKIKKSTSIWNLPSFPGEKTGLEQRKQEGGGSYLKAFIVFISSHDSVAGIVFTFRVCVFMCLWTDFITWYRHNCDRVTKLYKCVDENIRKAEF